MDPAEQNDLLGRITAMTVDALEPGWQELAIEYRTLGRCVDIAVGVLDPGSDGYRLWEPPLDAMRMFQRLRGGMYREGEGTWFSARFVVSPPGRFSMQYNWQNEPHFDSYPHPAEFVLEQRLFPRTEGHMPDWFRAGLAAAGNGRLSAD